jgi:hypothetical protein
MRVQNFLTFAPTLALPAVPPAERLQGMQDAIAVVKDMALTTKDSVEARYLMVVARRIQDKMEGKVSK